MTELQLLKRFTGDSGRRLLAQTLMAQWLIGNDAALAGAIADVCELRELVTDEVLINQGDADNDIYFIISGSLRILVNGREVAVRTSGCYVGEMALIDPSLCRTATNVAMGPTLVARVAEKSFVPIADANPRIWRAMGAELSRRLDQRARFHRQPNSHPRLFIGSSSEALPIAQALVSSIPADAAEVTLWSQGVFGASRFPIEDLEAQLGCADFAVLVAAPDDRVIFRGDEFDAPRDNVIFELGLFMGALSRGRTFILAPKITELKIPTDILGLTQLRYSVETASLDDAVAPAVVSLVARIRAQGTR